MPATRPRLAHTVSAVVAVVLAAVLLVYSLRGIDWRQVGHTLASASPWLLAFTCGINTLTLALRAVRWRVLLNAEGDVGYRTVFWATAAGYFGNNFLPARAGELVRTFMVRARASLPVPYVLATALSERVIDAIALVLIGSLVLVLFPAQSGWLAGAARPFAILGFAGAITIAVLPLTGDVPQRLIRLVPAPAGLRARLADFVEHGVRGLRAFHDGPRLAFFLLLTVIVWTGDAVALKVTAAALGLPLSWHLSLLVLAALGLASALPSTPGYIGIYQFVAVVVLTPFGFTRGNAIAFILVVQAMSYLVNAVWGAIGFAQYRRTRQTAGLVPEPAD
jgi:uncharacterized protein (TIRG00374 family)